MARVKYELAPDICEAIRTILRSGLLPHIREDLVHCVRSYGSRTIAVARIYGIARPWIVVLGEMPGYVIEVIHEKFDFLPPEEKISVLVHELLHIPKTFSGALRPHGKYVNDREVRRIVRKLRRTKWYRIALELLKPS